MLIFGKDSDDEDVVHLSEGEYKLPTEEISSPSNKYPDIMKLAQEAELPPQMYSIGKRMRYADGYSNKQLLEKARIICRKENLDWFVAMSFLKDISSGTIIH